MEQILCASLFWSFILFSFFFSFSSNFKMQFSSLLQLLLISTCVAGLPTGGSATQTPKVKPNSKIDVGTSHQTTTRQTSPSINDGIPASVQPANPLARIQTLKDNGIQRGGTEKTRKTKGTSVPGNVGVENKRKKTDPNPEQKVPPSSYLSPPQPPQRSRSYYLENPESAADKYAMIKEQDAKPLHSSKTVETDRGTEPEHISAWMRIGQRKSKSKIEKAQTT